MKKNILSVLGIMLLSIPLNSLSMDESASASASTSRCYITAKKK